MNNNNVKPWYKVWWIWIIIVIVLIVLFAVIGSSDSSDSSVSTKEGVTKHASSQSSAQKVLDKQYKVGETIDYKGYKVKVNNVNYDNGDEFVRPKNGNKYVAINVTVQNNTSDKQDYNEFDFKLSADGNATDLSEFTGNDTYDNNTLGSGTLAPGAKATGYLVGQANPNAKLKLQYQPSFFDDKTVDIDLN